MINYKITFYSILKRTIIFCLISTLFTNCNNQNKNTAKIKAIESADAELTAPPFVPKPLGNRAAMKLKVSMEIIEKEGEMADGVKYIYWTFGGSVPGSFIRTRVGDEIEFHLKNHPNNKGSP